MADAWGRLKFGRAFTPGCRVVDLQTLEGISFRNNEWLEEVRTALRYRPPEWRSLASKREGPIHPVELCREVQKLLDVPDAVLVCDGGASLKAVG